MPEKNRPIPQFPQEAHGSTGYQVARTALDAAASFVPGAGYAVGALVDKFVGAPLQKRRDEWFELVGDGLRDLQDRLSGFDPSTLDENEEFISVVAHTTASAIKTHREEKREALLNATLNMAAGYKIDDLLLGSFLGIIDRYAGLHIQVLRLLANPSGVPEVVAAAQNVYMGAQMRVLRAAPFLASVPEDQLQLVLRDLSNDGLAETGGISVMASAQSMLNTSSTGKGEAFLKFISSPLEQT
ncbi:hypothetical protein ACLBXM_20175 [Xanthobacteraceae bacterium A53D]